MLLSTNRQPITIPARKFRLSHRAGENSSLLSKFYTDCKISFVKFTPNSCLHNRFDGKKKRVVSKNCYSTRSGHGMEARAEGSATREMNQQFSSEPTCTAPAPGPLAPGPGAWGGPSPPPPPLVGPSIDIQTGASHRFRGKKG